jgi:hypothetical protein
MRLPLARALEIALADPGAWLVAAAGFLARGGVLLFVAVVVELPSPITVTLIFGLDAVTGTGQPSDRFIGAVLVVGVVALGAILAMVLVAAWADVVLVGRVRSEAGSRSRSTGRPTGGWMRALGDVIGSAWLQSVGLLPAVLAVLVAAPTVGNVAVGELLLPSSTSVPYLVRVLEGAQGPLLRALLVLAVAELVVTIATRRYLAPGSGRSVLRAFGGSVTAVVRRPAVVAGVWLVGWAALVGAVAAALWAVSLAWAEVRSVFLDPALALSLPSLPDVCQGTACRDPLAVFVATAMALAAAALFAAVWITAVAVVGLASAFRSSLWTLALDDARGTGGDVRWPVDAPD